MTEAQLTSIFQSTNQEHLIQHYQSLVQEEEKENREDDKIKRNSESFAERCFELFPSKQQVQFFEHIFEDAVSVLTKGVASKVIEPPQSSDIHEVTNVNYPSYLQEGLSAVHAGECAVVILAGGSGTRLGKTFPKGMLEVPWDGAGIKSLFQWHCQRVLRVEALANSKVKKDNEKATNTKTIQVAIMTSEHTHQGSVEFFAKNNYFGLDQKSQVHFFQQGSMPCFTPEGKVILSDKGKIATAPNGNGGIYGALADSGTLEKFIQVGTKYVQIVTIDNLLCRTADPVLFGFAKMEKADVVVKTTPKAFDHEPVGVFAKRDGRWGVIEYTEIGQELAAVKNEVTEKRKFDAANIAIHLCTTQFLSDAQNRMKQKESAAYYHAAKKVIPTKVMSESGGATEDSCRGIKLEAFIFDIFEYAKNMKILQVNRSEEFGPIKNADAENGGSTVVKDSPTSALQLLRQLHGRWLYKEGKGCILAQISPLVSYTGEGLESFQEKVAKEVEAAAGNYLVTIEDDGTVKVEKLKTNGDSNI